MAITIKIDKQRETPKGYSIIIYINHKNKRKNLATGYHSQLKDWSEELSQPKKSHPNFKELMDYVLQIKFKILEIGNLGKYSSIDKIISILQNEDNSDVSFMDFWKNLYKEYEQKGFKKAKNYREVYNYVSQFKSDFTFDDVNYSFLINFRDFKLKTGCSPNGVHSYLRTFRAVYNEAIKRDLYAPKIAKNPFLGVMPKLEKTKDKFFTLEEMQTVNRNIPEDGNLIIKGYNSTELTKEREYHYHNYFLLCFFLGGIDFIDLANLRYDLHVKKGRIKFKRFKGGTNEMIDNFIFPEAQIILNKYKSKDSNFLIPINLKAYESARNNYQRRFSKWLKSIGIETEFGTKTPRYTFINVGKQLQLNRDIIMELTGHARSDTHSIYEGKFPDKIKDDVHRQIIDSIKTSE